jgi:fumarate hydratase class II
MLVTALSPVIGYDKASQIAHRAMSEGITLRQATISSGFIEEATFDEVVDPRKMIGAD